MPTFKIGLVSIIAIFLYGCATEAVIVDLEDDKVVVRSGIATTEQAVKQEARRGCALHGKSAVMISYTCMDSNCFTKDVLFACR
ncbi:MAG: hypothetical protein OXS40_00660 [Gammaproteobacteria bacterium]|nr:hypothetical protein [Gammaproteobacteria bacterium]